jgi:hypothetical protein
MYVYTYIRIYIHTCTKQDTPLDVATIDGAAADVWQEYDQERMTSHILAKCQQLAQVTPT